jgi:phage recombination protein Bet
MASRNPVQLYEEDSQVPENLRKIGITASQWNALSTSIFPGAHPDSIRMALDYCIARKLDPLQKPVHIVPMWVDGGMRDVVMPGIGLYRIQAQRSGTYAGTDDIEFGPDVEATFKDKDGSAVKVVYPEFARATAYKMIGEHRVPFTATVYWKEEYATDSRTSTAPNAMWRKRPRGQLAKCAESQVLRKAWPEIDAGPTVEEMEGKVVYTQEREAGQATVQSGTAGLKERIGRGDEPRLDNEAVDALAQEIMSADSRADLDEIAQRLSAMTLAGVDRKRLGALYKERSQKITAMLAAKEMENYTASIGLLATADALNELLNESQQSEVLTPEQRDEIAGLVAQKLEELPPY